MLCDSAACFRLHPNPERRSSSSKVNILNPKLLGQVQLKSKEPFEAKVSPESVLQLGSAAQLQPSIFMEFRAEHSTALNSVVFGT